MKTLKGNELTPSEQAKAKAMFVNRYTMATNRTLFKRAQMQPHAAACDESGGTLVSAHLPTPEKFNAMLSAYAPGCGCFTHVAGTNGGQMRCGASLTMLGVTDRYFCAACGQVNKSAHD